MVLQAEARRSTGSGPLSEVPVQSPFANFDPVDGDTAHDSSARGPRALENISPLFERLILEQESGGSMQDSVDPIKRRLKMDDSTDLGLLHGAP